MSTGLEDVPTEGVRHERQLGDSELAYYFPSRADGVNDMNLIHNVTLPEHLLDRRRVAAAWAIIRLRHPLLASAVDTRNYQDVRVVYDAPASPEDALKSADGKVEYRVQNFHDLTEECINGPRKLSDKLLSHLIIAEQAKLPSVESAQATSPREYNIVICVPHFIGDGLAVHSFAHEFFCLLGGGQPAEELEAVLQLDWKARCGTATSGLLPAPMESRLLVPRSKFSEIVGRVDFKENQRKDIGGHVFPRSLGKPRHAVACKLVIDEARTKEALKRCKSHGVSITAALFAVCGIAWARTGAGPSYKQELPLMIYSAMNLRPYFKPAASLTESFVIFACSYFNVVLPSFLPSSAPEALHHIFWHRAHLAKKQSSRAVKSPMVASRAREMARERATRARMWAKEDDEKAAGTWTLPPAPPQKSAEELEAAAKQVPSAALMGLSLMGSLDGIYKPTEYPNLKMQAVVGVTRLRAGGMIMFGYTLAGKLHLDFSYDEHGLNKEVVESFWANVQGAMSEFLFV